MIRNKKKIYITNTMSSYNYSNEDEEDGMGIENIRLWQETYDLKEKLAMEMEIKKFYMALANFMKTCRDRVA